MLAGDADDGLTERGGEGALGVVGDDDRGHLGDKLGDAVEQALLWAFGRCAELQQSPKPGDTKADTTVSTLFRSSGHSRPVSNPQSFRLFFSYSNPSYLYVVHAPRRLVLPISGIGPEDFPTLDVHLPIP